MTGEEIGVWIALSILGIAGIFLVIYIGAWIVYPLMALFGIQRKLSKSELRKRDESAAFRNRPPGFGLPPPPTELHWNGREWVDTT